MASAWLSSGRLLKMVRTNKLREKILKHLQRYLAGSISAKDAASWALNVLVDRSFDPQKALLEDPLVALAGLDEQEERFRTSSEDLEFFRECLMGKREYHRDAETTVMSGKDILRRLGLLLAEGSRKGER